MAGNGQIFLHSTIDLPRPPARIAAQLAAVLGSGRTYSVIRWEAVDDPESDEGFERVAERIPMREAVALVQPGWTYSVSAIGSPLVGRLESEMRAVIPSSILAGFGPTEAGFAVGPTMILNYAEHEHNPVVARTTAYLYFAGDNVPIDWPACRAMIAELPELRKIADAVREILGECRIESVWDI